MNEVRDVGRAPANGKEVRVLHDAKTGDTTETRTGVNFSKVKASLALEHVIKDNVYENHETT